MLHEPNLKQKQAKKSSQAKMQKIYLKIKQKRSDSAGVGKV